MKNFFMVLSPVFVIVVCLIVSSPTLVDIFNEELKASNSAENIVYASTDLGFVIEQDCLVTNSIRYLNNDKVVGECIWIDGGRDQLNKICDKLGLLILSKYKVEDKLLIEGSSALLDYFIPDRQANIQIAVSKSNIVIGSPIIYGSY